MPGDILRTTCYRRYSPPPYRPLGMVVLSVHGGLFEYVWGGGMDGSLFVVLERVVRAGSLFGMG